MDCEMAKMNIPLSLAGELSREDRIELLNHVAGCPDCRREMEDLEQVWSLMDQWKIEEPSNLVKARVMAALEEGQRINQGKWWARLAKSFVVQTMATSLGLSLVIYLFFPYHKTIAFCEANYANAGFLSLFPRGLIYFVLGMLYGSLPISISGLCLWRRVRGNPITGGLLAGAGFASILAPFLVIRCPEFSLGLLSIMILGIVAGALSGGAGTFWVLTYAKSKEA